MAIDIATELSVIATEPKGKDVKQAIYDALDKLSKGGGPSPAPTPIDPNEFLPGSAHARYYYTIVDGRIGITTVNPAEIIPVPQSRCFQYWPQDQESTTSNKSQTIIAEIPKPCALLAIVMHRYNQTYTPTDYTVKFFNGDAYDSSWGSPIYETEACGTNSGTAGAKQFVSIFRKDISEATTLTVKVAYATNTSPPSTSHNYRNRLAICLVALYDLDELMLIDNKLADSGTTLDPRPLDITRANGNMRLYVASTWSGNNSVSRQIWFSNDQPSEYYSQDHIEDFTDVISGDGRLAIAFDGDGGSGKPWVIDTPTNPVSLYEDDINYITLDVVFKDELYVPDGFALLGASIASETRYIELSNGRIIAIQDS